MPYPPDKGEKSRAFYQLRAMSARHEVDVFTLADDSRDLAHREALAAHCHRLTVARLVPALARLRSLPYLLVQTPLTIPYFYSARLRAAVRQAVSVRNYDRIFVYCSAMAQYVPWDKTGVGDGTPQSGVHIPVVMDLVDVDSDKWRQYAAATRFPFSTVYRREARNLRAYERKVGEKADCVLVATEREARLARQVAPRARVHVVPVGVDTAYFRPGSAILEAGPPSVIFTGDMSYFPNEEGAVFFARQVLPLIRRDIPDVRFLIVGRNPSRRVKELQTIDHVEVSGSVADVRPWFARASVAVVPLMIAAGIQTKILQAMASGLPVVATGRAVQGLTEGVAEIVDTGESAPELAAKVAHLLLNPELARSRGSEARSLVSANYSWDRAQQRLLQLIEDPSDGASDARPESAERGVCLSSAS
jgi:sugar transferase (PEP-CTERM/EpsH1 system associated)